MAYNEYGEWEDDYEDDYSEGPPYAYEPDNPTGEGLEPPDSTWDMDTGQWIDSGPADVPVSDEGQADSDQWVEGIPQDWQEDFIRRNPGDYSRIASAYGSDNFSDGGQESATTDIYGGRGTAPGQADYRGPFQGGQVKVGEDPFSRLITGGYLDMLKGRGQTPFGGEMEGYLRGLLERGGEIEEDPSLLAQRMEAARQPIEAFRRMQTNQGRAELANRGLISEPGQPQGVEAGFLANLDEALAPWYASAGQNLASQMAQERGQRFDRALSLGTGLASQQAQDYLNSLRGATERQATLSDIALGTLDRNITWNKFLAEYGMDRDSALELMQSGRVDDVNQMLELFRDYINASREGYR